MGSYSTSEENVNEACSAGPPSSGWGSQSVMSAGALAGAPAGPGVRAAGMGIAQAGHHTAYGRLIGKPHSFNGRRT